MSASVIRTTDRPGGQRGFSLLEVLVAILVLSFGLLGAVGLQIGALQSNREARFQATAVQLARELAERARANIVVAATSTAANNPYLLNYPATQLTASSANCLTSSCATALDLARWDVKEWLERTTDTRDGLPGARVVVCFDGSPYDTNGLPQWSCTNNGGLLVVKIGWTRRTTDSTRINNDAGHYDAATRPGVVMPLLTGS